ncbi:MAG TPA: PKD domain-containing protein [Syntrophobacteraceae bacterium]|nr:PKD domain-containing protein [Syntrophobacteraceae bacterium]
MEGVFGKTASRRTASCLMLGLLLACLALCRPLLASEYQEDVLSYFGAGGGPGVAEYAADLGIHWSRRAVDVNENTYDSAALLSGVDQMVTENQAVGVVSLGIINPRKVSGWLTAEQFSRAVQSVVERYDGDGVDDMPGLTHPIKVWELVNEYSSSGSIGYEGLSQSDFLDFMVQGAQALKNTCSDCLLAYDPFDKEDSKALLQVLPADTIDLISFHTYSPLDVPADPASCYYAPNFKGLLQELGIDGKPVWVTEYAFYDHEGAVFNPGYVPAGDQTDNARWMVQTTAWGFGSGLFSRIIYAEIPPPKDAQTDERLLWMALLDSEGNKREIYHAYKKLIALLDGFKSVTELFLGEDVYGFLFDKETERIYVLWVREGVAPRPGVLLSGLDADEVTLIRSVPDSRGNFETSTLTPVEGTVSLDLENTPVFLRDAPGPTAAFSAVPTTGVLPLAVEFTDLSTGAVTTHFWDFGDGETSSEQNPSHTYKTAGSYTVSLTVSGVNGSDTETKASYITVTNQPPTVTIEATDPVASESGSNRGTFTVSRTGDPGAQLEVLYEVGGSAANGKDYRALSGRLTLPAGASSATIRVIPVDDNVRESDETVTLSLLADDSYEVGTPSEATLTIGDNDPTVTIEATDPVASEKGKDPAVFTVRRTGNRRASLTVVYSIQGTAKNGVDYSKLSGRVKIPEGKASASVRVVPLRDDRKEGNETVILTLVESSSYHVGSPSVAKAVIRKDD